MKAETEERPASRADMVFTVRLPASGRNGQKKPISQSGSFGVDGRDGVDAHHDRGDARHARFRVAGTGAIVSARPLPDEIGELDDA